MEKSKIRGVKANVILKEIFPGRLFHLVCDQRFRRADGQKPTKRK